MYEIDFLAVEETGGEPGSSSGDAITMRFIEHATGLQRVVVIDGGYKKTGERVVEHIDRWYGTNHIDLMISTHPDQDHINGLATILALALDGEATVGEVWIHRPHDHTTSSTSILSNITVIDAVIGSAEDQNIPVFEPFRGRSNFGGHIRVLGPSVDYYEELLDKQFDEERSGKAALRRNGGLALMHKSADPLARNVLALPTVETLGEDGDSGPRNDSSVVTLLQVDGERMLFTGDAGIESMHRAWDVYERTVGTFPDTPLDFFQAPHHGSRRNLAPSVLNRIFGEPGQNPHAPTAFISSALRDLKHPSPKVTNALRRRNVEPYATESNSLMHCQGPITRPGYSTAPTIGPLDEND